MTIRSNPPGALVYIDNYEIGTTPVSTDYLYYGTRKFRLIKDGYETLTVEQRIAPPWYQVFPLDFVSENLVPAEIRDERTLDFQLMPQRMVPTRELRERAESLRQASRPGAPVPLPAAPLPPGAMPSLISPGGVFPPLSAPEPAGPGTFTLPPPRNRY
ncbi:MAG: PEGA domain-containing protein [Pirellulales bacterium]